MSIRNAFRLGRAVAEVEAAAVYPQPASPFATGDGLQAVVWADLLGADYAPLTRAGAMGLPAVARQRHLLCGTLARCPLVVMATDTPAPAQPRWTTRTDRPVSPYHRNLWTADDLLFHGWSLWSAERNGDQLEAADRIPFHLWDYDVDGTLTVNDRPVAASSVILIPGPHEGILNFGAKAIRQAIDNADAAATAARNPSAYLELHYTGDAELTDEQIDAHIQRWADARKGMNGGVSWTSKHLEVREHGTHESHLLIEGRNADAVDMSRLVSSPAAMADATNAGASLTYETTEGRNGEFIDYGVGLYMDAIAARLSMDDVVATGLRTAFDTSTIRNLTPAPTGAPTED